MGFGFKQAMADVAQEFSSAAADTKHAMGALAVLGVLALVVALVALGVGLKARMA